VTHGAYSEAELFPLRDAIEQRLAERSPAYAAADDDARRRLAGKLARCELVERWLHENGVIDEAGRVRPVVLELEKWENSARQSMRELAMTTMSRAELDLSRLHAANEWVALQEVQDAMRSALELATKYIPRERRSEYLAEARGVLSARSPSDRRELES
jgi:chlorite dismutase